MKPFPTGSPEKPREKLYIRRWKLLFGFYYFSAGNACSIPVGSRTAVRFIFYIFLLSKMERPVFANFPPPRRDRLTLSTKFHTKFYHPLSCFLPISRPGPYVVTLCGSIGKDFVYHVCGHEFESRRLKWNFSNFPHHLWLLLSDYIEVCLSGSEPTIVSSPYFHQILFQRTYIKTQLFFMILPSEFVMFLIWSLGQRKRQSNGLKVAQNNKKQVEFF